MHSMLTADRHIDADSEHSNELTAAEADTNLPEGREYGSCTNQHTSCTEHLWAEATVRKCMSRACWNHALLSELLSAMSEASLAICGLLLAKSENAMQLQLTKSDIGRLSWPKSAAQNALHAYPRLRRCHVSCEAQVLQCKAA